ncbi:unnamed protein product [Acanthosepion pharaonis]|uniref:Uncharacterized protein n=1 Tax=Acanthosepion pharaonis TaxID=158019 RepID=A0A812DZ14_ACAPH|nr:unnamed protein product [Sepia pharaonis]
MNSFSAKTTVKQHAGQNSKDQLEVTEAGTAYKVHSERPHLVSLGSGRLSTAVTLLPLHEGITRIGTPDAKIAQDIIVQGTGVENEHCFIENTTGVITLYPLAKMCAVDGVLAAGPIRLSQGNFFHQLYIFSFLFFFSAFGLLHPLLSLSVFLWTFTPSFISLCLPLVFYTPFYLSLSSFGLLHPLLSLSVFLWSFTPSFICLPLVFYTLFYLSSFGLLHPLLSVFLWSFTPSFICLPLVFYTLFYLSSFGLLHPLLSVFLWSFTPSFICLPLVFLHPLLSVFLWSFTPSFICLPLVFYTPFYLSSFGLLHPLLSLSVFLWSLTFSVISFPFLHLSKFLLS